MIQTKENNQLQNLEPEANGHDNDLLCVKGILLAIKEHEKLKNTYLKSIKQNTYYTEKNIAKALEKLNNNTTETNRLLNKQNELLEKIIGNGGINGK